MKLIAVFAWLLMLFGCLVIVVNILLLERDISFHIASLSSIFSFIQQISSSLLILILGRSLLKKENTKSIEFLSLVLKFFGLIGIATGVVSLIESVVTVKVSLMSNLLIVQSFLNGMLYLILSRSLLRKEKWAWYIGVVVFIAEFIYGIMIGLLFKTAFVVIIFFMDVIFIKILFKEKKTFIVEPKEKFSKWLSNPHFLFLVTGNFILYIISGVLLYLRYQK